jgi:quercetin dioxygenase-like cupin family protein
MPPHITSIDSLPELSLGPVRVRILMAAAATAGAFELIEFRGQPGGLGPRPHFHKRADESFIILSGALDMEIDSQPHHAPAGTTVHIPKGSMHVFRYAAPETRFISLFTPATGFDEYLRELLSLARSSPDLRPDPAKLTELMARYDAFV